MKIKFNRFDVNFEGHTYCILIPLKASQLWIIGYGNVHWGTDWEGNGDGLRAILYACVVLGFNPADTIIYFPIRNNDKTYFEKVTESGATKESYINELDMIFTTHQVPLRRSKWKKLKRTMEYLKPKTYVLNYDKERTWNYFNDSVKKWVYSTAWVHREAALELVENETLFYVLSRRIFQKIYLELNAFLESNPECSFEQVFDGVNTCVCDAICIDSSFFPYRKKKQMRNHPWVLYYDKRFESRVKEDELGSRKLNK